MIALERHRNHPKAWAILFSSLLALKYRGVYLMGVISFGDGYLLLNRQLN
jgi:hypothetical protein